MTIETETILMKFLEELKADVKETNKKLDKLAEDVNDVKVNQAKLEGKVETLEVKLEEKTKTLQSGQDSINNKLSTQNTWLLSLITGLVIGLLGLVAAVGRVVFFPT